MSFVTTANVTVPYNSTETTFNSPKTAPKIPETAHGNAIAETIVGVVVTQTVTAGGSVGDGYRGSTTSTTTSTMTRNVTLTDPINTHASTVVPVDTTRWMVNNTSVDTQSYIDISTFSASGLVHQSSKTSSEPTMSFSGSGTIISTSVVSPSGTGTGTSGDSTGASTGAVTSNIAHNHKSSAPKVVEVKGSSLPMLAGFGVAGVFGLRIML